MTDVREIALVTGASRGFGRAIAARLIAEGNRVVGIARGEESLQDAREELGGDFVPVVGDATDEALARDLLREYRPRRVVLNAGATPHMAPMHEQTWDTFSRNWQADTRHAFTWTREALRLPLAPGSVVVSISSGAALFGSPHSGGYASAKAAIRHIRRYAADESDRASLGIRFVTLLPQLTPATALGAVGVDGYARRQQVDRETFVNDLEPILTADALAKVVAEVLHDPASGAEYRVSGAGHSPIC